MKRAQGWKQKRAAINKRRGWHKRNPARQMWLDAVPARVITGWDQFGDLVREDIEGRPRRKVTIRPTLLGPLVVTPITGDYMVGPVNSGRIEREMKEYGSVTMVMGQGIYYRAPSDVQIQPVLPDGTKIEIGSAT